VGTLQQVHCYKEQSIPIFSLAGSSTRHSNQQENSFSDKLEDCFRHSRSHAVHGNSVAIFSYQKLRP